VSKSDKMRPTQ